MHPLDLLAAAALVLPRASNSIFSRGWGDRLTLELVNRLPLSTESPTADIAWQPKSEHRGFRRHRGLFTSPNAALLPDRAKVVPVELNEPASGSNRVVVLMPAWNDEGFDRRRKVSEDLVGRGIATAYFDVPFYGRRRVYDQGDAAIGTVADFVLMGAGALGEGHALINTLRLRYLEVGVGGFSMGGNLAALISAGSDDLATGVMAAAHSPGPVYVDGVLRRAIAWSELGGKDSSGELSALLGSVTATGQPPRPHHQSAVMVGGDGDGFVPASAVSALAEHWRGSELRWLPAGHATLWWRHQSALVDAIYDSFEKMAQRRSIN